MFDASEFEDVSGGADVPFFVEGVHKCAVEKIEAFDSQKVGKAVVFTFRVIQSGTLPKGWMAKIFLAKRSPKGFSNLAKIKRALTMIAQERNEAGQIVTPSPEALEGMLQDPTPYIGNVVTVTAEAVTNKAGTGTYIVTEISAE